MKPFYHAGVLALALAFGAPVAAETAAPAAAAPPNVSPGNPAAIADLMKTFGYRAELATDDQGDPKIKSSAGGANFSVFFYGCTANKDCQSIQFSAGFDLPDGTTLDVINDWNTKKRFGQAYLDSEKDPYIQMDINMSMGGISQDLFRDDLDLWDKLVAQFRSHVNF